MDIATMKAKLDELAEKIESLIMDFEGECDVEVSNIYLNRIHLPRIDEHVSRSLINVDLRVEL